jgi:hypothetical protein
LKLILGHKSITSTETYIHIEKMLYQAQGNDQFTVKVADTLEDAVKLMEVGFEFHAEIEGHKLFRKKNETTTPDTTHYSKVYKATYGIISQPLYFRKSKSPRLIVPLSIN